MLDLCVAVIVIVIEEDIVVDVSRVHHIAAAAVAVAVVNIAVLRPDVVPDNIAVAALDTVAVAYSVPDPYPYPYFVQDLDLVPVPFDCNYNPLVPIDEAAVPDPAVVAVDRFVAYPVPVLVPAFDLVHMHMDLLPVAVIVVAIAIAIGVEVNANAVLAVLVGTVFP